MRKILLLLFVCFVIQSCSVEKNGMKKEFTEKNNAIPPDFGVNKNEVLLVVTKDISRYDKTLLKTVKKYYSGKYEIISQEEYNNDLKFPDKLKYRFIFNCRAGRTLSGCRNEKTCFIAGYKRFFVYDRLNEKRFESGAEFGNYGLGAEIYLKNLNAKQLSN